MPIDEYEHAKEICEIAELYELSGIIAERSTTPAEEYVSLAEVLKKNGAKVNPMTEQEEYFVHFVSCITWLNNAWRLLNTILTQPENPLIGPAFRFALVEYCKPYKLSHGINKKFKLDTSLIPEEYLTLHERIVTSRDQIHAHSDITVMDAKLHVHEFMGQKYALIPQNIINVTEELPNLQEVITLIEATLDNMYLQEKVLENALTL